MNKKIDQGNDIPNLDMLLESALLRMHLELGQVINHADKLRIESELLSNEIGSLDKRITFIESLINQMKQNGGN